MTPKQSHYYTICLALVVLFFVHPAMAYIASLITVPFLKDFKHKNKLLIILISLTLSLILSTQSATGLDSIDFLNYFRRYNLISLDRISLKNPIYDTLQLIFSKYLQLPFRFFSFLIFNFYFLSCYFFSSFFTRDCKVQSYFLTFIIGLGVINFVQTGELLRQNLSIILFLFSIIAFEKRKLHLTLLIIIIALGIHHSTLFYVVLFALGQLNSILLISCIFFIISFYNHNYMIAMTTCKTPHLAFICEEALKFYKFGWKVSFKEHISILVLAIFSYIIRFKPKRIQQLTQIDKFCLIYLLFLVGNLSTPHNFIRFINTSSPIFVIIFSRSYAQGGKIHFKLMTITIGLTFCVYNLAAIYKRTTRETYQSNYLYRQATSTMKMFTWEYFDESLHNPDQRIHR